MSIFFSQWKEEETPQEELKNITGNDYLWITPEETPSEIEKLLSDSYTSRSERKKLLDLQMKMNNY